MTSDAGSSEGQRQPLDLPIRLGGRQPTLEAVNRTLRRLGTDVEWTDEAVEQLQTATAAAEQYLRSHPEKADLLVRDPAALLRELAAEGLLEAPLAGLEKAVVATRAKLGGPDPSATLSVRLEGRAYDDHG